MRSVFAPIAAIGASAIAQGILLAQEGGAVELAREFANYGFPAVLVILLLWGIRQRDNERDKATKEEQAFTRKVLVDLLKTNHAALAKAEETQSKLAKLILYLTRMLRQSKCMADQIEPMPDFEDSDDKPK